MKCQVSSDDTPVPRVNILGVGVHALNMKTAVDAVQQAVHEYKKGYVCVTGVHGIMEAQADTGFKHILNDAFLVTPDGMPTVWLGRMIGHHSMRRVYGPDFMMEVCRAGVERGVRHFLYGGNTGVAERLKVALERSIPGVRITGCYTPPFRPLNEEEEKSLHGQIEACGVDVLWVGLSTPKQERFMAHYLNILPVSVMAGVGAAFDIHTGGIQDAPRWMKQTGLQWLHRLCQEPKRLSRRYLVNNPKFIWLTLLQYSGLRGYRISSQDT